MSAHEEMLDRLAVVESSVADRHTWRTDGKPTDVELAAGAVAEFGGLVHEL